MSEVRINLLDANRAITTTIHGSYVDCLVATLSADPATIEELDAALARYLPDKSPGFFLHWRSGTHDEPYDAGICVIDLAARLVVNESTYSSPGPTGAVTVRGREDDEEAAIPYHLAKDWQFRSYAEGWEHFAKKRRTQIEPPLDARPILYDKVCEFIARACFAAAAEFRDPSPDREFAEAEIRHIHRNWLMTPRDDLRGRTPREILLRDQGHISWDMQDRQQQWSIQLTCPPALATASAAYRYGGFGTHEIVIYYDLVRFLLSDCWDNIVGKPLPDNHSEADVVFETKRLLALKDQWLASPNFEDFSGTVPGEAIDMERRRVPEAMGHDHMIDHDCPLCQMMADSPSPAFWCLDGSHMDDEFAFSFHETREEWDEEKREWEEFNRKFAEEQKLREEGKTTPLWTRSCSQQDPNAPVGLALFGIGAHLAELTQDIKDAGGNQEFIDSLNRDFGNLREAFSQPEAPLAEPVTDRFCESLQALADAQPKLWAKCNDLERQIRELTRRILRLPELDEELPF